MIFNLTKANIIITDNDTVLFITNRVNFSTEFGITIPDTLINCNIDAETEIYSFQYVYKEIENIDSPLKNDFINSIFTQFDLIKTRSLELTEVPALTAEDLDNTITNTQIGA